jgi:hypothetical protein
MVAIVELGNGTSKDASWCPTRVTIADAAHPTAGLWWLWWLWLLCCWSWF